MANEALLDTSVWVTILEEGRRIEELGAIDEEVDLVTSPLVIGELSSLATRGRLRASEPAARVMEVSRFEDLTAEDAVVGGELHGRLRRQADPKASLADCLAYATARRIGALFVTYDSDLAGQPGVKVLGAPKKRKKP